MAYTKSFRLSFPFYYNTDSDILGKAREQRKLMTPAEKRLWSKIRGKSLGGKFRRQHPINRFIADFYCHEARLVVEVDGGYHDDEDQAAYDLGRTREMEELGIKVIRFTDSEVCENLEEVVTRISDCLPHPPDPLPHEGKGEKSPSLVGEGFREG